MVAWLLGSLVGVSVIALPDTGPRLFSLSEGHGPSLVDSVGIVVLLVSWMAFVVPLWRNRERIAHPRSLGGFAMVAAGVILWSVGTDSGRWWILGAVALGVVQVVAAVSVLRSP